MNAPLLILLVGELVAPLQSPLVDSLPVAFPDSRPEVAIGMEAPPGRSVAWVRMVGDGSEVELVLHTALVQGELRRVVRFGSGDAAPEKARTIAFTLAAMVYERDAKLQVKEPAPIVEAPKLWVLDGSVVAGFDVPGFHGGGGLSLHLRRDALDWLQLGAGAESSFFAAPGTLLVQPALFAESAFVLVRQPLVFSLLLGAGVAPSVLSRDGLSFTTWLPLLRAGAEARWRVGSHHGLRLALSTHLVFSTLNVEVGGVSLGTVGAVWIRPEFGYFVEL